jgi:hypothetical protein
MNEDVEIVCRFCLDGTKTPGNPLLEPCECKGSIQFVHKLCLIRWRHQNVERNGEVCLLCNTTYKIPLDTGLERIPDSLFVYLPLDHPILSNIVFHYCWGIFRLFSEQSPTYSVLSQYGYFQLFTHSLLLSLMLQRTKVRNWSRYSQRWFVDHRWAVFVFHALVMCMRLFGSSGLSLCVSNLIMQVYWKIHIEVLEEMNQEILDLNL